MNPELHQLRALLSLLDDTEEEVWKAAFEALCAQPYFENESWYDNLLLTEGLSQLASERADLAAGGQRISYYGDKLLAWKDRGGKNLLEAMVYICRFRYPEVTEAALTRELDTLRLDAWMEFHYDLTSFEKVKILNYILFQLHGFRGDEENFLHHDNSFLNKVIEHRKGNPISLSIVYLLVAQRLNVPVYGINLPRHFIMAYVEDDETSTLDHFNDKQEISHIAKGEIKFYINAYNGGGVFNRQHLETIMKEMELEEKPEYTMPCTNQDIVLRVLMNLYNSYNAAGNPLAEMIDRVINRFVSSKV